MQARVTTISRRKRTRNPLNIQQSVIHHDSDDDSSSSSSSSSSSHRASVVESIEAKQATVSMSGDENRHGNQNTVDAVPVKPTLEVAEPAVSDKAFVLFVVLSFT